MLTGKPPWSPREVAGDVLIVLSSVPFGNLSSSQPTSPDFGHSPPGSVGLNRLSAAQRRSYPDLGIWHSRFFSAQGLRHLLANHRQELTGTAFSEHLSAPLPIGIPHQAHNREFDNC